MQVSVGFDGNSKCTISTVWNQLCLAGWDCHMHPEMASIGMIFNARVVMFTIFLLFAWNLFLNMDATNSRSVGAVVFTGGR